MRACSSVILWVDFTLIFSLLSYHWQVGASTLGIASALYGLPGLMLGPLFGRLADRHPPFKLLYLSYLARSLTSLLLIFAPSTLVFCKGLGNLGAMPTEQVLVRVLLSQNQIVSNASLTTAIDQISKICAPLVGTLLAQWFRPAAGFGLSALLALLGLALLHLLQRHCQPLTQKMAERPGATIGALFALLRRDTVFRLAFYATVMQSMVYRNWCHLEEIGTVTASARSAQLLALVIGPLAGAALSGVSSLQLVFVLSGSMALLWGGSLWKVTRLSLPKPRTK